MPTTDRRGLFIRELDVATRLALAAGEVVRRHAAAPIEERHKSSGEVVSAADLECDALLRGGLAEAFPDDAILSEETSDSAARLGRPGQEATGRGRSTRVSPRLARWGV